MQLEGLSMYESLLLCEDSARHSAVLSSPLQLPNLSEPNTRDDMVGVPLHCFFAPFGNS
jgi:hypothetical protein